MITGIHTYSKKLVAVAMRDNATHGMPYKPEWRYEVCFAKMMGIGRNGCSEMPFGLGAGGVREANSRMMIAWCDRMGIESYHVFPSGVGFPNEDDQLLCFLTFK